MRFPKVGDAVRLIPNGFPPRLDERYLNRDCVVTRVLPL